MYTFTLILFHHYQYLSTLVYGQIRRQQTGLKGQPVSDQSTIIPSSTFILPIVIIIIIIIIIIAVVIIIPF